jgi:enamine deaminase RidA (YjgF/YER057c/UK114 family)
MAGGAPRSSCQRDGLECGEVTERGDTEHAWRRPRRSDPVRSVLLPAHSRGGQQAGPLVSIDDQLKKLGIELPVASDPAANYANCARTGALLFVSGKGPVVTAGPAPRGKLGTDFTTQEGYAFARLTGLDILAAVKLELGSLDRVVRVVKLQGFVNAAPAFEEHPQVLNGCSDLMVEIFGDRGVHARSVLGASSLRAGLPIVIDSIFEVS